MVVSLLKGSSTKEDDVGGGMDPISSSSLSSANVLCDRCGAWRDEEALRTSLIWCATLIGNELAYPEEDAPVLFLWYSASQSMTSFSEFA